MPLVYLYLHMMINKPDNPFEHGTLRAWQDWPWHDLDALVISPGIPHLHPTPHPAAARAAAANIEILSEVEIAYARGAESPHGGYHRHQRKIDNNRAC